MKKLISIKKKSYALNKVLLKNKVGVDLTNVINHRAIKTDNINSPKSNMKLKTENYIQNTPYFNKQIKDQIKKYSDFKERAE